MRFRAMRVFLLVLLLLFPAISGHAASVPLPPSPLPRYVHDDAGWLGAHSYSALDLRLERLERETGWKLLVAILPGLPEGEEAAGLTRRMLDGWLPGRESQERAVLLAAYDDRTIRFLAGGVASVRLPEAERDRVVSEILAGVAEGDREAVVGNGVESIIAALARPQAPTPASGGNADGTKGGRTSRNAWTIVAISSLMVAWLIVRTIASRRASAGGRR
ncbi:MAG: TPM domain-containing protein [Verrucomicrobiaceae bacterium]|nr:MAG: TPM domain-containing protein [Verrucomicrobiaceae bacterium]